MSPEDMQRFEITAQAYPTECAEPEIRCNQCAWSWSPEFGQTTLADLVQRAGEHTEVCR